MDLQIVQTDKPLIDVSEQFSQLHTGNIPAMCRNREKESVMESKKTKYQCKTILKTGNQVDKICAIRNLLLHLAEHGSRLGLMLSAAINLRCEFGLNTRESFLPIHILEYENGRRSFLLATRGEIPVKTIGQEQAIDQHQKTSELLGAPSGSIIPPDMTLPQAYEAHRIMWQLLAGPRTANGIQTIYSPFFDWLKGKHTIRL